MPKRAKNAKPMARYTLVLFQVIDASRHATADCIGLDYAARAGQRANHLAGMIELAGLLALPVDIIDALNAHRGELLASASRVLSVPTPSCRSL